MTKIRTDSQGWPEAWPELKAEDFVCGPFDDGCRKCLLGWAWEVSPRAFTNGSNAIRTAIRYGAPIGAAEAAGTWRITSGYAKDTLKNRRLAADFWNNHLRKKFGYTGRKCWVEV